jgi:hypothetical protein
MTIEERMDRLTGIVEALASSVVSHDNQIDGLIKVAEEQKQRIDELAKAIAATERQWQAYINTLPRQ